MESLTKFKNLSQAERQAVDEILSLLKKSLSKDFDQNLIEIVYPPETKMGDYSVPCFLLSKKLKENPAKLAQGLSQRVADQSCWSATARLSPTRKVTMFEKIESKGPYLNFFVSPKYFKEVLSEIDKKKERYGQAKKKKAEKIMVEYIQPNTHKEFHVGHLRNVCLGSSLVNILRSQGDKIVAATYVNDFGIHVAQCLWGWLKFGAKEKLPQNKGKYLGQLYARSAKIIFKDEKAKEESLEIMKKLQSGDKEIKKLWLKTRKWSLDQFDKIYQELGIKFDAKFLESQFYQEGMRMVNELIKKGLLKESEGAVIADLNKYNLGVLVFLRSDGTTLYPVSDVSMAWHKFKKYNLDRSYYVVDVRQSFYFQQLFKILELQGLKKPLRHIDYEFVTLPEGAMASRHGRVILLDDLTEEVFSAAREETKKRHPKWSRARIEKTARAISWAAIKFGMLKQSNEKIIVFDIKKALEFTGFTGPYLQYMHARINSILKKAGKPASLPAGKLDFTKLNTPEERELIKMLSSFSRVIESAAKTFQPSILAQYLYDLASIFSSFYEKVPVLKSDTKTKSARLFLISQVKTVLATGLGLLGIEAPEEM